MIHQTLFKLVPCRVALVNTELVVQDASQACAKFVGAAVEELVGRSLLERLTLEAGAAGARDDLRRAIAEGRESQYAAALASGGASEQPFRLRMIPLADGGQRFGLVHIDDQREGQLAAGGERLESILDAIRTIKHDINNPLTGALGNINLLLRRDDLDEKTRRRLTVAEQEMKKISQIVVRLSNLAPPQGEQ